jgi:HD superfamily phosphohydrolase
MSIDLVGSVDSALDVWVLDETIGSPGEQGEVWLAHSQGHSGIKFAIKIGRFSVGRDNPAYREFVDEFDALASLSHPQIVRAYHRGVFKKDNDEYPFYVMEYLGANVSTFDKALKAAAVGTKVALCLRAFLDTALALEHVHSKGRVHGDIKESNILVSASESDAPSIKLIDFGFSRMLKAIEEGLPGRRPTKESSKRRPESTASPMHYDMWQLAHTIKRALDEIPEFVEARRDRLNNWPIDYADYDHLYALLKDWSSIKVGSPPEVREEIENLRGSVRDLKGKHDISGLSPDVKNAIRYFAVPELATAAHIQPAFEAIRIPPRQLVLYTERIKEVITAPEMGALRYTRQLGLTHLVYPGAQGTRFEHCLGVYGLACRFLIRMIGHPAFRKACTDGKDVLKFLLAALLHDIGHFPLAHQLEEFSVRDFTESEWDKVQNLIGKHHDSHRRHGLELIKGSEGLAGQIRSAFSFNDADIEDLLCLTVRKREAIAGARPAIKFLHSLLDGPIDLDKLDYAERDAHHCGVPYGHYLDIERVLETMRIRDDPAAGVPFLAFDWRAVGSLEQIATARHQMYANVFWHRAVRSATTMFKHAFYLFQKLVTKKRLEDLFFTSGSDDGLLAAMRDGEDLAQTEGQDALAVKELLEAVCGRSRRLYKEFVNTDHTRKHLEWYGTNLVEQRATAQRIFEMLQGKGLLASRANTLGTNNILIDCHADASPAFDEIQIVTSRGETEDLGQRFAPSVKLLRDNFKNQACRIRVFMNLEVLKDEFHDKLARADVGKQIMAFIADGE